MSNVNKCIMALSCVLATLISVCLYLNIVSHPLFLEGKNNSLLFGHSVTYSQFGVKKYREFHTIDHKWSGLHSLHTTIGADDESASLKVSSLVYFWSEDLFSNRDVRQSKNDNIVPDLTEAHMISDSSEQFFQIIYQDSYNFCYISLRRGNVKCITADQ